MQRQSWLRLQQPLLLSRICCISRGGAFAGPARELESRRPDVIQTREGKCIASRKRALQNTPVSLSRILLGGGNAELFGVILMAKEDGVSSARKQMYEEGHSVMCETYISEERIVCGVCDVLQSLGGLGLRKTYRGTVESCRYFVQSIRSRPGATILRLSSMRLCAMAMISSVDVVGALVGPRHYAAGIRTARRRLIRESLSREELGRWSLRAMDIP